MTTGIVDGRFLLENSAASNRYFCENYIWIDDRNRNKIQFKYNPAQDILHKELTGRDVVIKAGQLGITSFFLARYFKDTILTPGTTSVVVAHEEFLTQRLLNRMNIMYESLPEYIRTDLGPLEVPKRKHDSAHEKTFPSINSVFYIGSARAFVFGRGEPIHRFLGSEVAFWPDADRILVPSMQRVPIEGQMVLESTPNGEGNRFHEIVQEALDDQGRWSLIILEWWLEPEYRLPVNSPYVKKRHRGKIADYSADELKIIQQARWDDHEADERIRWRRIKIEEITHMFWQEFFEDIASCFVTTSDPYYDQMSLDRLRKSCFPAPMKRTFEGGLVEIWEEPDMEEQHPSYMIAVDPGQGLITQSVALVFRTIIEDEKISYKHVASLAGLYDPQTFAPMVMELGKYYRIAKIASEANGHGMAFTAEVADYPNLYYRTDVVSGVRSQIIGWKTTGAPRLGSNGTKTYMMSELNHILKYMECTDVNVIRQIGNVRIGAEKQLISMGGDDYHDAAAIFAATSPAAAPAITPGFAFAKNVW